MLVRALPDIKDFVASKLDSKPQTVVVNGDHDLTPVDHSTAITT